MKSGRGEVTAWWNNVSEFHTQAISPHDHIACNMSSSWVLNSAHIADSVICRRWRLAIVGSALWQALQMKSWIFLGTRSCQIPLQNFLVGLELELPTRSLEAYAASILYALLVENWPDGVRDQVMQSRGALSLKGMFRMASASCGRKFSWITSFFHSPFSWFIRLLTVAFGGRFGKAEIGVLLGWLGSH